MKRSLCFQWENFYQRFPIRRTLATGTGALVGVTATARIIIMSVFSYAALANLHGRGEPSIGIRCTKLSPLTLLWLQPMRQRERKQWGYGTKKYINIYKPINVYRLYSIWVIWLMKQRVDQIDGITGTDSWRRVEIFENGKDSRFKVNSLIELKFW